MLWSPKLFHPTNNLVGVIEHTRYSGPYNWLVHETKHHCHTHLMLLTDSWKCCGGRTPHTHAHTHAHPYTHTHKSRDTRALNIFAELFSFMEYGRTTTKSRNVVLPAAGEVLVGFRFQTCFLMACIHRSNTQELTKIFFQKRIWPKISFGQF